jgi:PAS domain S-box-containing protein
MVIENHGNMKKVNSKSSSGAVPKSNDTELNKLRLVFEQTPGAIFILDKNFRFEYVNPSFTKLSGYSKEELINKTVAELFYHNDVPDTRFEVVKSLMAG